MNDGAKVLSDMFPDIPQQTLTSILQSCGGSVSTAVDEALTLTSLGNGTTLAQARQGGSPASDAPHERWEDASSVLPGFTRPTLAPQTSVTTLSSSTGYETAVDTRRSSSTAGFTPTSVGAASTTPGEGDSGHKKLPWEGKEARYVIGPGELGLLNELQMPRRGAIIPLDRDFLRLPKRSDAAIDGSGKPDSPLSLGAEALVPESDERQMSEHGHLFSPIVAKNTSAARKRDSETSSTTSTLDDRKSQPPQLRPPHRPPPGRAAAGIPGRPEEDDTLVSSADAKAWEKLPGGDSDGGRGDKSAVERTPGLRVRGKASLFQEDMRGQSTVCSADATPPVKAGRVFGGELASAAARKVETASAAERIAAFRPGTRFRVAVDKGLTGLGITVKEIRGRFFVYKLQALADGSPGAAEEAGVQAGDQLLGVEELDFETERWDMDQLVSYMGELMGVVILHMMRGCGPLPQAPKSDFESGMSYGVARADNGGGVDGPLGENAESGSNIRGLEMAQRRARRLVDVLEEEKLSKPPEAADVSRLYCQISDRAKQWDTGELWLSVTELARRPSRETLAAMAKQWQPDAPPGWEESDSSEGDQPRLPTDATSPTGSLDGISALDPILHPGSLGPTDGDDPSADLDQIGTALLGQPMFANPARSAAETGTASASSSQTRGGQEGSGHYWSPWPQLAALESRAAQRSTVVPTRGLRKALNVRILRHTPPPGLAAGVDGKTSDLTQTVSYLVWVMDVESGAEWRVGRCHSEFAGLKDACTRMRPSLARLDFPPWLADVKETPGVVEARRPRLEAYLQRLCSLLYVGPLHPSSANLAHLLQDFLGTSPRVETLGRLQKSRPEREVRQALQVRAWQVFRLPPLERAVAEFVREVCEPVSSQSKKAASAETTLKRLTEVIEHLQYVVTEGCFDELREMVRSSTAAARAGNGGLEGGAGAEESKGADHSSELESLVEEDEALELISGSVRRQVEAEVFVPVMTRIYEMLRTEGPTARLAKAVSRSVKEARGKPQSFHGVPIANISPSSWNTSVKLLQTVGLFTLPCDKLDALMAVAHDIPALHRKEHPGDGANGLGADDFLPIFIYVLVNSGVEDLAVQSVVLETLCDPKKMMGEAGFCDWGTGLLTVTPAAPVYASDGATLLGVVGIDMEFTVIETSILGLRVAGEEGYAYLLTPIADGGPDHPGLNPADVLTIYDLDDGVERDELGSVLTRMAVE
eukprot:g5610.t1